MLVRIKVNTHYRLKRSHFQLLNPEYLKFCFNLDQTETKTIAQLTEKLIEKVFCKKPSGDGCLTVKLVVQDHDMFGFESTNVLRDNDILQ
jgi:hypothetical protein